MRVRRSCFGGSHLHSRLVLGPLLVLAQVAARMNQMLAQQKSSFVKHKKNSHYFLRGFSELIPCPISTSSDEIQARQALARENLSESGFSDARNKGGGDLQARRREMLKVVVADFKRGDADEVLHSIANFNIVLTACVLEAGSRQRARPMAVLRQDHFVVYNSLNINKAC